MAIIFFNRLYGGNINLIKKNIKIFILEVLSVLVFAVIMTDLLVKNNNKTVNAKSISALDESAYAEPNKDAYLNQDQRIDLNYEIDPTCGITVTFTIPK